MKKFIQLFLVLVLFSSCDMDGTLDLNKVKNPEKDVFKIYENFQVESITKEDLDYDENMDVTIIGYDEFDNWVECVFIHNGDLANTYSYIDGDEFWGEYDYDESYEEVEDYFDEVDSYNKIEQIVYGDITQDGIEDAIAISFYDMDDYQSIDAYIFVGSEDGYYYEDLAEIHYLDEYGDYSAFQNTVIKDNYFTFELGQEKPYWDRYITFKYDTDDGEFYLHKDGGTIIDEDGNLVREEVLTQDDFGDIYFYEFIADDKKVFSLKLDYTVSNTTEFLAALGNNRVIYLEEGVYPLNDLALLPKEAQMNFASSGDFEEFFESNFYTYMSGSKEYESEIELYIRDLRSVDIIGLGDVEMIVDDEFIAVLNFESCNKVFMENIYMVHEVQGECGANVVNLNYSSAFTFEKCVFDGSGELGVYADESYDLNFIYSDFTNCTSGAADFYESTAYFESCSFEDNQIWYALVSAYSYSSIDFYNCSFSYNNEIVSEYGEDNTYLFYAEDDSYIYLDSECEISDNNEVSDILNDDDLVIIESSGRY